jgi:metacaspase-1
MAKGYSLHIGLNRVNPAAYHGWNGALSGCVNDAIAMGNICRAQGFDSRQLLNEQATASALLGAISDLASRAASGATIVISFSGHGGQLPDSTGTESDGLVETWVCYDRMLVDKELHSYWSDFPAGTHLQVYSDSCHSGTVIRELRLEDYAGFDASFVDPRHRDAIGHYLTALRPPVPGTRAALLPASMSAVLALVARTSDAMAVRSRYGPGETPIRRDMARRLEPRFIPPALVLALFRENKAFYMRTFRPGPILCGVTLISACQDNQLAEDGTANGLFTEKLLQVWAGGAFNGTLRQFHAAITMLMPQEQTPNYDVTGAADDLMASSKPLTIIGAGAPSALAPHITAPESYDRGNDIPPEFMVEVGPGRNYVVEIATGAALFANPDRGQDTGFYGSWQDSPRQTAERYTLPQPAWKRLRDAERLYYRVGSTTSPAPNWDGYLLSTPDADASAAPSIRIIAAPAHPGVAPTITALASFPRGSDQGPTFTVSARPYFAVELATDPSLFAVQVSRTPANFFASWDGLETPSRLQGTNFTLPTAAWGRLKAAERLYYRVLATTSSSSTGWDDFRMSLENSEAASAPFVRLTGAKAFGSRDAGDFDDTDQLDSYLQDQRAADTAALSTAEAAHDIVLAFRASEAASPWTSLDRATVADRLDELIDYPRGMRQGGMNVCGPAAFFMMALARDPVGVAQCAAQLFDTGAGSIGGLTLQPREDLLNADFNAMAQKGDVSSQFEWMLLGALRNSTTVFWQPSWTGDPRQELAGMTRPEELAD